MVERTDMDGLEIQHLREVVALRDEAVKTALMLQAKEYERRLSDLNGEANRLKEMQATYVKKDVYDVKHESLCNEIRSIQRLVNIGIGILLVIELLLRFAVTR